MAEMVKALSAGGFEAIFPVFNTLAILSKDKRFTYNLEWKYRKNEWVCTIDLFFEEYNLAFKDVVIIWFNDSDENIADESHLKDVKRDIESFAEKVRQLSDTPLPMIL